MNDFTTRYHTTYIPRNIALRLTRGEPEGVKVMYRGKWEKPVAGSTMEERQIIFYWEGRLYMLEQAKHDMYDEASYWPSKVLVTEVEAKPRTVMFYEKVKAKEKASNVE